MKDYSSLESKIRKLVTGRLQPGGWEQISETLWIHPVAEIARMIDPEGKEHYFNKAGEYVDVIEDNSAKRETEVVVGRLNTAKNAFDRRAKLLKQSEIKIKIIDEVKRVLDYMAEKKAGPDKAKDPFEKVDKEEAKVADDGKDPKKIAGGKTEVDVHPTTDDKIPDDSKEKAESDKASKKENKKIVKESKSADVNERKPEHTHAVIFRQTGVYSTQRKVHVTAKDDHEAKKHAKKLLSQAEPAGGYRHADTQRLKEEMLDEISKDKVHRYIDKSEYDQSDRAYQRPSGSKGHADWKRKYKNRNKGLGTAIDKVNGKAKVNATEDFSPEELERLDEISNKTLKSYVKKAEGERGKTQKERRANQSKDPTTFTKRTQGVTKAKNRLFARTDKGKEFHKAGGTSGEYKSKTPADYYKEDILDEVSSKTLDSYKSKALSWVDRNRSITPGRASAHVHLHKGTEHKHNKRWQGISRATTKAANNDAKKEEFSAQIDEISDKKAGEYFDKGHKSWKTAKDSGDKKTMEKRSKGGSLATKKMLNVNVKIKTTKEEFSPEELAHFEAVMDEAYVDMSKKKCDEVINAKGKPHKVYTATDETRHGIGVDELKRHMGVGDSGSVHKKFMHNLHTAGVRTGWSHSAGKWIAYHGPKI